MAVFDGAGELALQSAPASIRFEGHPPRFLSEEPIRGFHLRANDLVGLDGEPLSLGHASSLSVRFPKRWRDIRLWLQDRDVLPSLDVAAWGRLSGSWFRERRRTGR